MYVGREKQQLVPSGDKPRLFPSARCPATSTELKASEIVVDLHHLPRNVTLSAAYCSNDIRCCYGMSIDQPQEYLLDQMSHHLVSLFS